MPASRIYLDHNATTPLRPQAHAAFLVASALSGNPSSVHAEGRLAKGLIETQLITRSADALAAGESTDASVTLSETML